jgi:uncharacterized protein YdbL (DUF1318 family)
MQPLRYVQTTTAMRPYRVVASAFESARQQARVGEVSLCDTAVTVEAKIQEVEHLSYTQIAQSRAASYTSVGLHDEIPSIGALGREKLSV